MAQPSASLVLTGPAAKAIAAVLRRGLDPFVCARCGGRFPAARACPVCDADPRRTPLADAVRLALAEENDARAAFLRSPENGPHDPFASGEPGPLFLSYRSAAETRAIARRALDLYDAAAEPDPGGVRDPGREVIRRTVDAQNPRGVSRVPLMRDE